MEIVYYDEVAEFTEEMFDYLLRRSRMNKPIVFYHADCMDGFCTAWVIWRLYKDAEFYPSYYGKDPAADVWQRDVIIVDFSFPRETMDKILRECNSLLFMDHHKTAQENLLNWSIPAHKGELIFDMGRSGAGIAWDMLFDRVGQGIARPNLVSYVEDRDLWRFRLPESKVINARISILPIDKPTKENFEAWDRADEEDQTEMILKGNVVIDVMNGFIKFEAKKAIPIWLQRHKAALITIARQWSSELLDYLIKTENLDIAIGWFQRRDGVYQYSLRSRNDVDVSVIAKQFGGGGHKNAAGFESLSILTFDGREI